MHYHFIEIGTSDFETLIQNCDMTAVGLSIDPLQIYLDKLPKKPYVTKVNAAISDSDGEIDCYYVPEHSIKHYNLPDWVRGCNSVGSYHKTVYTMLQQLQLRPESIIQSIKIPKLSICTLLERYHVESCDFLKIDTEGHDCIILENYITALLLKKTKPARKLQFESNVLSDPVQVDTIIYKLELLGYKVISKDHDTVMEISDH
jgi:FkbM family methyltransferase